MSGDRYLPGGLNPEALRQGVDDFQVEPQSGRSAGSDGFFARMREAMGRLGGRSTHTGVTKYRAIVLTAPVGPGATRTGQTTGRRYSFRIRIPELHQSLPDPCKAINTPDGTGLENSVNKIIYMHPTAISADLAGVSPDTQAAGVIPELPNVGDIVWVEFEKSPGGGRMASPIYISMCDRSTSMAAGTGTESTADVLPNNLTPGVCMSLNDLFNASGVAESMGSHAMRDYPIADPPPFNTVEMSPSEAAAAAKSYDDDDSIPKKANHAPHFADGKLHPEFIPYVKKFIYECWTKKQISIQINSGFRDREYQRQLYDKWVAEGGEKSGQPKPSTSLSMHSLGMAIDFNPEVTAEMASSINLPGPGRKIMVRHSSLVWQASGVVDIAQGVGLRWGGSFGAQGTSAWDPIHLDWGTKYPSRSARQKIYDNAIADGKSPNTTPTEELRAT